MECSVRFSDVQHAMAKQKSPLIAGIFLLVCNPENIVITETVRLSRCEHLRKSMPPSCDDEILKAFRWGLFR